MLPRFKLALPYLALILLTALLWSWSFGKVDRSTWNQPLAYSSDGIFGLAYAKAFETGEIGLFQSKVIPHLGAPGVGNWNNYPITEDVYGAFVGWVGRAVNLFWAGNLWMLCASCLTTVSFYYTAVKLGAKPPLGFVAAFLLAFSPFITTQTVVGHMLVATIWHLPLTVLMCHWLSVRRVLFQERWRLGFLGLLALATGWLNPSYSFMFCQLLGLLLLSNLLTGYRRKALTCLAAIGVVMLAFVSMNLDTFWYSSVHGANLGTVTRNLAGAEIYGMKIADLFAGGFLSRPFRHYYGASVIAGEQSGYMGVVSLVALLWLVGESVFFALTKQLNRLTIFTGLGLWILLFSLVGGVNHFLAVLHFQWFRATNRFSIYLQVLALLFLVVRLSGLLKNKTAVWLVAGLMLMVGGAEQFGQQNLDFAGLIQQDRVFTETLENKLATGAMVFQLPVMQFPEVPPHPGVNGGVPDYDHLRPYLYSKNLRFSYGTDKGRGEESWQLQVEKLSTPLMIKKLQELGFSGLYLNRYGYPDAGVKKIGEILALGYPQIIPAVVNRNLVAFDISPLSKTQVRHPAAQAN